MTKMQFTQIDKCKPWEYVCIIAHVRNPCLHKIHKRFNEWKSPSPCFDHRYLELESLFFLLVFFLSLISIPKLVILSLENFDTSFV